MPSLSLHRQIGPSGTEPCVPYQTFATVPQANPAMMTICHEERSREWKLVKEQKSGKHAVK